MNYQFANDARRTANFLLAAILLSVGLWIVSWFLTIVNYLLYPLQLFATFIHEGSHVLAAVLTGSNVQSLTVSPDTSGVVWSQPNGWFAGLLISSAGYLGTTTFGTILLAWLRYNFSARLGLYISAGFIGIMTIIFGLIFPIFNIFSLQVSIVSIAFTVFSGAILSAGLFAIAKYADLKWANFALAFLSVQCLLNAFFSLKDLFFISASTNAHSDAVNMAQATGIPSLVWVFLWIVISILLVSLGLRIFVATQKSSSNESLFNE
jgi:hypothetical protein